MEHARATLPPGLLEKDPLELPGSGPCVRPSKGRGRNAPPISPLAMETVERIDVLFDIERGINGESADQRLAVRKELSAPVLADLKAWMDRRTQEAVAAILRWPRRWTTCSGAGSCSPASSTMAASA